MGQINKEIELAWLHRMNQNIEESRLHATKLKKRLGIPLGALQQEDLNALPKTTPTDAVIEVLVLCAANARADGQNNATQHLLTLAERHLSQLGLPIPFSLHFQRGILAQVKTDYSCALEYFLAAKLSAKTSWQRVTALTNALFCLENLGLPLDKSHEEICEILKEETTRRLVPGVVSQLQAFHLRNAFRNGNLQFVFDASAQPSQEVDQNFYYRLWVAELPFHTQYQKIKNWQKESFSIGHPWFHQKSYRLRTLQGILHPDDLQSFKVTEFSDRFYLWTWRWLADPDAFPIERVMALVRDIKFDEIAFRLTAEDYQLIRNALLWLGLFDPASFQPLCRLLNTLKPPQAQDYPLFNFEREVILYFVAQRDHAETEALDFAKNLFWHPLWQSKDLWLKPLVESFLPTPPQQSFPNDRDPHEYLTLSPLGYLAQQLKSFLFKSSAYSVKRLTIDLSHSRLSSHGHSKPQISAPLCLAFSLLHAKPVVEAEEFMRVCFGISQFEPEIHQAKIFNLLARMRKIAPTELCFYVKSGKIYAEGSWSEVTFQRRHSLAGALQDCVEWKSIIKSHPPRQQALLPSDWFVRPVQALKQFENKRELSREELEKVTGKSKSTASRMIQRWLEQGILKKTGKAKNTRYLVYSQKNTELSSDSPQKKISSSKKQSQKAIPPKLKTSNLERKISSKKEKRTEAHQ